MHQNHYLLEFEAASTPSPSAAPAAYMLSVVPSLSETSTTGHPSQIFPVSIKIVDKNT